MNITEQDFYLYVPSATNPEGYGIFNMVANQLEVQKGWMYAFLGAEMQAKVDALAEVPGPESFLVSRVKSYICNAAFFEAIPSLDLVLTPTGFGVVSNQNVAPASAERVANLRKQVETDRDNALDSLLEILPSHEEWCNTAVAMQYFSTLIYSGQFAAYFGLEDARRKHLAAIMPRIQASERKLMHLISPQQFDEMLTALRIGNYGVAIRGLIARCRNYIYADYQGDAPSAESARRAILEYLELSLADFPLYANSPAYKANHYANYESKKEDTCFFFG